MKKYTIKINKDWCKGCELCVAFCPRNVLEIGKDRKAEPAREEDCTGCLICELKCPDFAITVSPKA
ncbi:hypothetical protein CH333_02000 [candidate division WOR-3 bacterium JGI_Cruoil_03_44_89]|uniref:4Fe-4S ferredoxin-type domain-containing protein n=1 Tax=candidate division WOR-3 bacterium JGI_Cruoil_03_44_89 TaxID=1973748 RepID=A0A235BXY3_UNCW3|nr:MAG: hypothetical protein CH333_02000 [candidate division WOR-3 bacterium JGI_Cruoil_03_44_89]